MKKYLGRTTPWLITLLLIGFLVLRGGDLRDLRGVLGRARWLWLLMAIVCQAGAYGAVAWLNELLLRHYGVSVPWFRQYIIQYAMAFVEAAVPSAAISGLVLRARLLKPYGASADVATVTTLVETALIGASVLAPALYVAGFEAIDGADNRVQAESFLGGVLFLVGVSTLAVWLWRRGWLRRLAMRSAGRLGRMWDQQLVPRWPQRLAAWPSVRLQARLRYLLGELALLLCTRPHTVGVSLLARTACEAAGFILCFYAFGQRLPLTSLLLLYTVTVSVNTLGAIPGGVGLAEVSLAALYTQFAIAPESAVAIALAYRVTGYWLPRAAGGLAWLWLERSPPVRPLVQELLHEPE